MIYTERCIEFSASKTFRDIARAADCTGVGTALDVPQDFLRFSPDVVKRNGGTMSIVYPPFKIISLLKC